MSRFDQASNEAGNWIVARADGPLSAEQQAEFDAWFAASEGNKAAYWRLERGWEDADRIASLGRLPTAEAPAPRYVRKTRWLLPVAASIALAVSLPILPRLIDPAPSQEVAAATYETAVGRQRTIGLPDGSRVQLNTASEVRAAVTDRSRDIWLDRGEAFFEVAQKQGVPFIVHAADRRITVLGTKFSVRRDGNRVVVTVLEGRVRVDQVLNDVPVRSAVIVGGDIALTNGEALMVASNSDARVEGALSWRNGMLTFDQDTLTGIAAEFNRYNDKKMVVADPEAGATRISGVFPAGDPDGFTELLRDAYGLEVTETSNEIRISN